MPIWLGTLAEYADILKSPEHRYKAYHSSISTLPEKTWFMNVSVLFAFAFTNDPSWHGLCGNRRFKPQQIHNDLSLQRSQQSVIIVVSRRVTTSRSHEEIPTGIWKDTMTVSGTILLMYFETGTAEISEEGEDYTVSLHFLHKCMVALIQVTETTRDTITDASSTVRPILLKVNQCLDCLYIQLLRTVRFLSKSIFKSMHNNCRSIISPPVSAFRGPKACERCGYCTPF